MLWVGLGILYFLLLVTLGIMSIRKGHWVMFIIGIFFPLFWLIGALMPPRGSRGGFERLLRPSEVDVTHDYPPRWSRRLRSARIASS